MTAEVLDIQDLDGVGPVTANKLREAGYDSISSLAIAPIRELVEKAGLETSVAHKISKAARETIQTDFVTAKQLWERRKLSSASASGQPTSTHCWVVDLKHRPSPSSSANSAQANASRRIL